jgi:hypothetical protein
MKFFRAAAASGCEDLAGGLVAPKLITGATNPPALPDDGEVGRPSHPDAAVLHEKILLNSVAEKASRLISKNWH